MDVQGQQVPHRAAREVLICGATGATGRALTHLLLTDPSIDRVHLVTRRATPWDQDPKVQVYPFDLEHLPALAAVSDCYCCLGTTAKQAGSRRAFQAVDRELVEALGRWAAASGVERFHVISSAGADARSLNFYLRTKGEMEQRLEALGLPGLIIYRPPLLAERNRDFRLGEQIGEWVLGGLGWLPGLAGFTPLPVSDLAKVMVAMSRTGTTGRQVVDAGRLKQLARL